MTFEPPRDPYLGAPSPQAPPATATPATPAPIQRGRFGPGAAIGTTIGLLVSAAFALSFGWVLTNQQRVVDQFAVWDYEPDPAIVGYADRAGLTEEGRFLFYASKPTVEPEDAFDEICGDRGEGFGILGCYLPSERRIVLYDVTDERLDGIEEVVATHELLHAVWHRMSRSDRAALEPLLEEAAAVLADDEAFQRTMEFYAVTEPGQRLNELHSILGTEVADLPPALEAHYAQYVLDRGAVVALHERTAAVFAEQQARGEQLLADIDALVADIDADYARYSAGYAQLNADIDAFNARASSGDFSSQAQFDAERNALLARQAELDALYATIVERQGRYDALVAELEALNAEIEGLNASINIDPPQTPDLSG